MVTVTTIIRRLDKKVFCLTLLSYIFFYGCQPSFDEKLKSYIDESCPNIGLASDCLISLSEFTKFKWDTVYVFSGLTYPQDITQAIGFDCACSILQDDYDRIVFTLNKKIVRQTDYHSGYFDIQFRKIDYLNPYSGTVYSSEAAKFYVKKKVTSSNKVLYDLFPVDRISNFN